MDDNCMNYVRSVKEKFDIKGKILDVGSLNVCGTVKPIFEGCDYIGLDMRGTKRENVDIIANAHDLPYDDETFDCVTCVEMLEHDSHPFQTFSEIYRVLKPGGHTIITACSIRCGDLMEDGGRHGYPEDYWRFTAQAFLVLLEKFEKKEAIEEDFHVYGYGVKCWE